MAVVVTTKAQLKQAKEAGEKEITINGDLANKLKKSKQIAMLGGVSLGILVAALGGATVTAPVTGGMSYLALASVAAPVAAITGIEIAAIIVASSLGIALIIALFKDYEEISYKEGELKLRKKQRSKDSGK